MVWVIAGIIVSCSVVLVGLVWLEPSDPEEVGVGDDNVVTIPALAKGDRRPDFICYAHGLIHASACTSLSDEDAERQVNLEYPTGIDSPWQLSGEATFADGSPHPAPCPDSSEHRHVLFVC